MVLPTISTTDKHNNRATPRTISSIKRAMASKRVNHSKSSLPCSTSRSLVSFANKALAACAWLALCVGVTSSVAGKGFLSKYSSDWPKPDKTLNSFNACSAEI